MARITQGRRIDETDEAQRGIEENPTAVRTTNLTTEEWFGQIVSQLRIMNAHLELITENNLTADDIG